MKKFATCFIYSALLITALILSASNSNAQTASRIRLIFGTRSHPASGGDGCEGEKGICVILNLHAARTDISSPGYADVAIEKGRLRFNITEDASPANTTENFLNLYTDKALDPETCRSLGYDQLIMKAGRYPLDKTKNPFGSALINIQGY